MKNRFALVVFLLYACVTLFVTLQHEPWRDEADTWLILRDGGLRGVFARTALCGTPALWHLLIAPLVALELPYVAQSILNLLVAWLAIGLWLFRAPFSPVIRASFALSYYATYEYAVIARPYALMMLLLFSVAALWEHRREHAVAIGVAIALLANTTTHGLLIGAVFGAMFVFDSWKARVWSWRTATSAACMVGGGVLAVLQLVAPVDAPHGFLRIRDSAAIVWSLTNALLPGVDGKIGLLLSTGVIVLVATVARPRALAFFLAGSIALLLSVYYFIWMGGFRHAGLILLIVVVTLWMSDPAVRWRRVADAALALTLLWSCAFAAQAWWRETRYAFTGAEEMAAFIRTNGLERYEIAAHNIPTSESLLPYFPGKQFYFPGLGRYASYMMFDREYERGIRAPYENVIGAARWKFRDRPWLLLLNVGMEDPSAMGFRLAYANQTPVFGVDDEQFWLYVPLEWNESFPAEFTAPQ